MGEPRNEDVAPPTCLCGGPLAGSVGSLWCVACGAKTPEPESTCPTCRSGPGVYVVLGRGPFCSLPCAIAGTADLVTDADRAEARRMAQALGVAPADGLGDYGEDGGPA